MKVGGQQGAAMGGRDSTRSPAQQDRRYLQPGGDRSGGRSPFMDACSPASSRIPLFSHKYLQGMAFFPKDPC